MQYHTYIVIDTQLDQVVLIATRYKLLKLLFSGSRRLHLHAAGSADPRVSAHAIIYSLSTECFDQKADQHCDSLICASADSLTQAAAANRGTGPATQSVLYGIEQFA